MIEEHVRWTKADIELLRELARAIEEWKNNERFHSMG